MTPATLVRTMSLAVASVLLPACGGGGGSSAPPLPPPPVPDFSESFEGTFPGTAWFVTQNGGTGTLDGGEGSPAPSLNLVATTTYQVSTFAVFNSRPSFSLSFSARAGAGTIRLDFQSTSWLHAFAEITPTSVSLGQLYKAPTVLPNDGAWHDYAFETSDDPGGFRLWRRDGVVVWQDGEVTQTDAAIRVLLSGLSGGSGHFDNIVIYNPLP